MNTVKTNANKIVLDLCGGTGAWSRPYQQAGYDVRLVTLPALDVLTYDPPKKVYGILAAPPCTEFSLAKGARQRNFHAGMETVTACLHIIWKCRLQNKLKFWALENPRGFLRQFLGIPHFTYEQWQYGDNGIKPTDIWGYFNEPKPLLKKMPESLAVRPSGRTHGRGMSDPKVPDWCVGMNLERAEIRAITPPGFAAAFFKSNK